MRIALVLALGLTACSDLPDLGTCGNGVIEADNGEACDGDVGGEHTCSSTCQLLCLDHPAEGYVVVSQFGDEEYCPDARMACGLDGVCRAPSSQFAAPSAAQNFDVKQAVSGDFDGDGIADLIGTSATQLVVRLGASSTPFSDGFEEAAPSAESPLTIFDRDPDHLSMSPSSLSIAVPTDGLALLQSDTEVFGPDLDLIFDLQDPNITAFVVRDPDPNLDDSDAVYTVSKSGSSLAVERVQLVGVHSQLSLPSCGSGNQRLVSVAVSRDRTSFVVVARPMVGTTGLTICNYVPVGNLFQMTAVQINAPSPDGAILAQIDNDPCLDLVLVRAILGGGTAVGAVLGQAGTCAFSTTAISLGTTQGDDSLLAAGSIVPRGGPVERDELVMTSGVYELVGGASVLQFDLGPTSDINPWTSAAVVDLNGDGVLDVVAGRKNQDDIDVVRGGAVPNVYRADTAAPVSAVVAGDFDGDLLGDAALVEVNVANENRISIVYGTHDGVVGAPVVNSQFGGNLQIIRLRRAIWSGSARGIDGVDDLAIARAGQPTRGGLLVGDAARLMTTLRIPPPDLPLSPPPPVPIGVVGVGKLTGTDELFAGALRVQDRVNSTGNSILRLNNIATTEWLKPVLVTGFEVDTARPAQILRTTGSPLLAALAKPAAPPVAPTTTVAAIDHAGGFCSTEVQGSAFAFRAADIDGDDELDELVVSLDDSTAVHAFKLGPGSPCTITGEILEDALAGCADVVKVGTQTVALCKRGRRAGLFRISDGVRDEVPFAEVDGFPLRLVAGDFDGDGVPDLAVGIGRAAEISTVFVKQCPANDVRGCN